MKTLSKRVPAGRVLVRFGAILALTALVGLNADPAPAQCLFNLQNTVSIDSEYTGLHAGGARLWVGQEFTTTADGQFMTASFLVKTDFVSFNGVTPLATGELLVCTVLDDADQPIASVTGALGSGFGFQWVDFDFAPLDIGLAAGPLSVRVTTASDTYCWVSTSDNQVAGRLTLGDESSAFASEARDTSFKVSWDVCTGVVGTEESSWGAVKALFR